jgi:hypothetical protein
MSDPDMPARAAVRPDADQCRLRPGRRSMLARRRSRLPGRRRLAGGTAALATAAVLAAACGSTGAGHAASGARAGPATASLPLATSLAGPGQPGWAVVPMGGPASRHDNFWELFVRPAGSTRWQLVTPPGVASNGGLMISGSGAGLLAGFGPSQDLTFSPLAATAGPASTWSQGSALVSPGLAGVPDALATGPAGQLLALTRTGEVLLGTHDGATWTRLATLRSVAGSAAARGCGLTALTAVAFSPAGAPLVAGTCARQASVGIFTAERGGTVQIAVPALPAGMAAGRVTVLGLTTQAGRTTALIEAGTGKTATVLAAWWAAGARGWTVSAPIPAGGGAPLSVSLWAGGSVALVLAGGQAETIASPGAGWRLRPALPARTATLALGPDGQLDALATDGGIMSVWQLSAAGAAWNRLQQIKVTIPYGSSG